MFVTDEQTEPGGRIQVWHLQIIKSKHDIEVAMHFDDRLDHRIGPCVIMRNFRVDDSVWCGIRLRLSGWPPKVSIRQAVLRKIVIESRCQLWTSGIKRGDQGMSAGLF